MFALMLVLQLTHSDPQPRPAGLAPDLAPPVQVMANGKPLDVERDGLASPFVGDFHGDGKQTLLVGQFDRGRLRIYKTTNTTSGAPKLGGFEWFKASDSIGTIPAGCSVGFRPQLVDLDGDGKTDILSGSWLGQVYLFRREGNGFAGAETLKHADGRPVNPAIGSCVFAYDWDGDGKIDLIVGTHAGSVFFLRNIGTRESPVFAEPKPLTADGKEIKVPQSAPVVADWDGDGKPDLIVGGWDGSVVWFRNEGTSKEPKLAASRILVPPSPSPWRGDKARKPNEWGLRARPCVVDWDRDGKLDLLVGDMCGGFSGKPTTTAEEAADEKDSAEQLPALRKQWAAAYQAFTTLSDAPEPTDLSALKAHQAKLIKLQTTVSQLKDEITRLQEMCDHNKPGSMCHGYVWFFRRITPEK